MIDGARILITGGTGTFGKAFVTTILRDYEPRRIIIFSRDEFKMSQLQQEYKPYGDKVDYFIGNVEKLERCRSAFVDCDIIIHAAAMKQVPMCEAHPFEAVETNIIGAHNVCTAALENEVKRIVFLSTDKAVAPTNLYGTTKLAAEKICLGANVYTGGRDIAFSVVRYGNVAGSRGSVIPVFRELLRRGETALPVTNPCMTRFWLTIDEAVQIVIKAITDSEGGEVFIPKMPSFKITDLVAAMGASWKPSGIRPGEKVHETIISEHEAYRTCEFANDYVIGPDHVRTEWCGAPVAAGFHYSTDTNSRWLSVDEIEEKLSCLK